MKDNRIGVILPAHLMRKHYNRCLHLVGQTDPVLCGKQAGQHCPVCGVTTCSEHLSRKTITLYGHIIANMCYMCAEFSEEQARTYADIRRRLEVFYEKTDLWPE